ncbi:hypothetical protein FA09DRAFT_207041 [Tilletiopsis washingtonensis]|uniref:Uncharacterized protein n=1 Tax=Tilletiopsis washingtonensis TaxID=58919 RepID=A0A316ZII2_9BASI|nr:hypothetical protein FA09DRAFT_207041 [Tilletiopsis washingtonensis]PWO00136.1 hypothetical protein FA09DRAFT_207041 [Tilletiopsis washingtonensis]
MRPLHTLHCPLLSLRRSLLADERAASGRGLLLLPKCPRHHQRAVVHLHRSISSSSRTALAPLVWPGSPASRLAHAHGHAGPPRYRPLAGGPCERVAAVGPRKSAWRTVRRC